MISRLNVLGCVVTSLLVGSSAFGGSAAVSVADLGRGPLNAGVDQNHDIIWHDASTGQVTLHFLTDTGLDLIESEFTLDGLELTEGLEGTEYSAGTIVFNNNETGGSGARANYEVNGRITNLEVTSAGMNHSLNTRPLNEGGIGGGISEDYGIRSFSLIAVNSNENGTNADADAYVAPYPDGDTDDQSHITGFKIISAGSGANIDGMSMPVFNLEFFPTPDNAGSFGDIRCYTDSSGGISNIKHESDNLNISDNIIHKLTDVLPEQDDSVYYFNQLNTNGLVIGTDPFVPRFKVDGERVQFNTNPVIEFYHGGEVVHVALNDEGSGFLSDPEFPDGSVQGGTGLTLSWQRRGPIHEITDFDPGSGYKSLPTISLSDPHGRGSGAEINLLHTEAFQGGPREMSYVDSGENVLLPGGGWTSTPGDFNGDGSMDLFWWNESVGSSMIWILQNGHLVKTGSLPLTGVELKPIVVDLDSDGISEIFWWNSLTGATWVWIISTTGEDWVASSLPSVAITDLSWEIVATGHRHGRQSIVWQSLIDGVVGMWTMSSVAPNAVEIASPLTYPGGEALIPGSNWHVIGSGDLNGDGLDGDLLWWAEEYNRIAIWIIGSDNFREGDYLTYNGQEVIIDASLGGIGTYSSNGHVNIVWNDGQGVVNWQMDRGDFSSNPLPVQEPDLEEDLEAEEEGFRRADEDDIDGDGEDDGSEDDLSDDKPAEETTTTTTTSYSNAMPYRIGGAWRMTPDGTLIAMDIDFFQGLPADLGALPGEGDGLGDLDGFNGLDDFDFGGLPGGLPGSGGGGGGNGALPGGDGTITIPTGMDPCDYICSLDKENPSTWPPEFGGTVPPEIIQGIWNILIDGLLDNYLCDPCAGGGGPVAPLGACCSELACLEMTEAECAFPGAEWLGEGTTCIEDCE
ncbi:MAG: VCBS repeat-containing protein [Phycisphaerales bacterium]|nr:VCBS repeat-containing protein [Phycisphaerales bacterium]